MIDYGKTPPYALMCLDVYLTGMVYLAVDWDSDLGKLINQLQNSVSLSLPDILVLNEPEEAT